MAIVNDFDEFGEADINTDPTLDLDGTGWETTDWIEDWQDKAALLNYLTYHLTLIHDLDGRYTDLLTTPLMASEKIGAILWVAMTSGFFHRVKLEALDYSVDTGVTNEIYGQAYHVRFAEATMVYQGQLV